jgi:hypothetical protein
MNKEGIQAALFENDPRRTALDEEVRNGVDIRGAGMNGNL